MTTKQHKRAAIYCRISEDNTGEAAGVERQRRDCVKYAKAQGWQVHGDAYIDNDVSASSYSRKPRAQYKEMLAAVERGEVDVIVAWHIDRLYRKPRDLEDVIDIADRVTVATLHGELDLTTADGRAMARVLVAMAAKQSDDTSRRVKRMHESLAEQGKPHGGSRPFGYQSELVTLPTGQTRTKVLPALDRTEARAIRTAVARVLAGGSLSGVARAWNEADLRTPQAGSEWTAGTVQAVLKNPRIAGLRVHRGEVVGAAQWPAIIEREAFEQLAALFTSRQRSNPRSSWTFAGIFRCSLCGSRMTKDQGRGRQAAIRCHRSPGRPNCGKVSIKMEPTEDIITEAVFELLDSGALATAIRGETQTDSGAAVAALVALEQRLVVLAEMFAAGEIDRAGHLAARRRLEHDLDGARAAVSRERNTSALDRFAKRDALRNAWPKLEADQQRAVLHSLIDRVVIGPADRQGSGHDPDRITIAWLV